MVEKMGIAIGWGDLLRPILGAILDADYVKKLIGDGTLGKLLSNLNEKTAIAACITYLASSSNDNAVKQAAIKALGELYLSNCIVDNKLENKT